MGKCFSVTTGNIKRAGVITSYSIHYTKLYEGTKRSFKFTLGDKIKVMIKETNPISGTTRLKYVDDYLGVDYPEKSDFSYRRNAGQKSRKPKLTNKSKKNRKNKKHK